MIFNFYLFIFTCSSQNLFKKCKLTLTFKVKRRNDTAFRQQSTLPKNQESSTSCWAKKYVNLLNTLPM